MQSIINLPEGSLPPGGLIPHAGTFEGLDRHSVPRTRNVEATISGPTMLLDGLTFFAAGRYLDQEGYLYGRRIFEPRDNNPYLPSGDFAFVSMNPSRRLSGTGKVTYNSGSFK